LVGAGLDGIAIVRQESRGPVFTTPLQTVAWTPTAIGATIGAVGARLIRREKGASGMAIGGLIGSLFGFGAALAWASRDFTGPAARKTLRGVNAVRDAHWLETHPITYA
jgi:hypothetical protein